MKLPLTVFFLLLSTFVHSQKKLDTLRVDQSLLQFPTSKNPVTFDDNVVKAIEAVDRKFIFITDTLSRSKTKQHTFFQNIDVTLRYLKPTKIAYQRIKAQKKCLYNQKYDLAFFKNDTLKYIQFHLDNQIGFNNPYPQFEFPMDSIQINLQESMEKINTKSIFFGAETVNENIKVFAKKLNDSKKSDLYDYLERNYTDFQKEEKELHDTTIRIQYITLGKDSIYVGIDIYGSHYIWTIDKKKNWDVVKVVQLWKY